MSQAPSLPRRCEIRLATAADRAAVQGLFRAHLAELGYEPDPRWDADLLAFPESYAGEGDAFLVAVEADGRVVGMAGLLAGEIRRVHVAASVRQRGLGRALVESLIKRAVAGGRKRLIALVARSNHRSQRTFRACGFTPTGQTPDVPGAQHCELWEYSPDQSPRRIHEARRGTTAEGRSAGVLTRSAPGSSRAWEFPTNADPAPRSG